MTRRIENGANLLGPLQLSGSAGSSGNVMVSQGASSPPAWSGSLTLLLRPPAGTASAAPLVFTSGTNLTNAAAGAVEYDGSFIYSTLNTTSGRGSVPSLQTFRLTGNGSNVGPSQGDFYGSTSAINLVAGGVYEFLFHAYLTKNSLGSGLDWFLAFSSGPTMVVAHYVASPVAGIAAGTPTTGWTGNNAGSTSVNFSTTSSVGSGNTVDFLIRGVVVANAATTFKLRVGMSSGTVTPLAGSFYEVRRVSTTTGAFA